MTNVYLISNNNILKDLIKFPKNMPIEQQNELLPLTPKGEKIASELIKIPELLNATKIYASNYQSAWNTAKYFSEELKIPIQIDNRLKERKIGILTNISEKFLKEMQEHDFDYHLHSGESLNMVIHRMKEFLKEKLVEHKEETILIFTHPLAIESLMTIWCEKGFNLENQLILNYKEKVILDGAYHPLQIWKLEFEDKKLKDIHSLEQEKRTKKS